MKYPYLFVIIFFLISACKQTDRGSSNTSNDGAENNLAEETTEQSASIIKETVVDTNNLYVSSIFSNDYGNKSIKYISWENVVKFIDHETVALSTYNRMTEEEAYYIGSYTLDIQDSIAFLDVNFDSGNVERWLILANGTLCDIYKSGNRVPGNYIHGVTGSVNRDDNIWFCPERVRASSYLIESGVSYMPENLSIHYWIDSPWVEGVEGNGVNEKIFFEKGFISKNGLMHISIGYVSYDKPYLYKQNSRPKKIMLSVENKFSFEAELRDTPHYQEIEFPFDIVSDDTLVLEILEVYPGTKYEDTCINSIYFEVYNTGYYDKNNYWEGLSDW